MRPLALGSCTERTLSGTALNLSEVRLGAMTWCKQNTKADAHAQLDYAIAQRINFVDTAETLERSGRASLFLFHVVPWRAIARVQERIVFA